MEIKLSTSCWRRISRELDDAYPLEGMVLPLVGLLPRRPDENPCATLGLADLRAVVIARTVLVPRHLQVNAYARVSVLPHTDRVVNREVERLTRRYPRLRACAYLHSHPFSHGSTWPSSGCSGDHEGHMVPLLRRNREAALATSFSFIACMAQDRWRLQGFALDQREEVVDLGFAQVAPDSDPDLRHTLQRSHLGRSPLRSVLRRWRRELRRARLRLRDDELFDGWRRWIIHLGRDLAAVVLLPMDFPDRAPRCHVVRRSSGHAWPHPLRQPLSLSPDRWVLEARRIQREEGA